MRRGEIVRNEEASRVKEAEPCRLICTFLQTVCECVCVCVKGGAGREC